MSTDPSKHHGLIARGAPVKPPLFKMPQRMISSESDRAHGSGGVAVMGKTHVEGHSYGSYYQAKQPPPSNSVKAETFDSGLDEITQRYIPITPVSCTEDVRVPSYEYLYQPKVKTVEQTSTMTATPKVEPRSDISDSGIEISASSTCSKRIKAEESEPKVIDSKILHAVHHLFVEDEDGER